MPITRVAIAGATGNLGPSIITALLADNFQVTVLTRSTNSTQPQPLSPTVKTVQVDYTSHTSLLSALRSNKIEALVSNVQHTETQIHLIDAAVEAGVQRFLPAEFGADVYGNENARELPVFKNGKVRVQQYLKEKSDERKLSWTVVVTSVFFDLGLRTGFLIDTSEGGVTQLVDDPDRKFSGTLLSDVGRAVVGVLQHAEETKNRAVYVQSARVSQNQILAAAKKARPGVEFETRQVNSGELLEQSLALLREGREEDRAAAIRGLIKVSILNSDYGSDFAEKHENELLGVKELSPEEVEKVVEQNVR